MATVFIVQHLHVLQRAEEDFKLIGVYATRLEALAAIERLRQFPGFRDFPNLLDEYGDESGFFVDEYVLNQDQWSDGFETV